MAIASIKGGLCIPSLPIGHSTQPSFQGLTSDAADEASGAIIQVPKTGNISKVIWATRTVTTGATVDVRIETLDTSGARAVPSGTLWGTNTNGAQVVADGDDNTSFATALTSSAAVTVGDAIAVVIQNPSAGFGNYQVSTFADDVEGGFPYVVARAVSWNPATTFAPCFALEYDDGSYEPIDGCYPIHSEIASTIISTSTTPDCFGYRFQLPFSARARGCWLWIDADGPFIAKLVSEAYHQANGTGIVAQTTDITALRDSTGAAILRLYFTSAASLSANTNYRLIVEPTSTTAVILYDFDLRSLAAMDAFDGGQNWHLTTAKDPTQDSDWTNYNSGTFRKPFMGLVLDGFEEAAPTDAEIAEAVWEYADRTLTA